MTDIARTTPGPDIRDARGEAQSGQWNSRFLELFIWYGGGKGKTGSNSWVSGAKDTFGRCGCWGLSLAQTLCPQVYSSMERLSLLEERRVPPPTKRSLSEEKDDRSDGLAGLKGRDRSWVIGSPEM